MIKDVHVTYRAWCTKRTIHSQSVTKINTLMQAKWNSSFYVNVYWQLFEFSDK